MPEFRFGVRKLPSIPQAAWRPRKRRRKTGGGPDGTPPDLVKVVQIDYWDKTLPGFGMRVSSDGTRTWNVMYRYNARKRRMKLGIYPAKSLADARDEAREVMRKAEKGADPATERKVVRARMDTVADLHRLYIEEYAKKKKRSWKHDDLALKREVLPTLGSKRIVDVTRQDVRDVLKPIIDRDAPVRANRTLEVIRKMFNWVINERDLKIDNPAAKHEKPGNEQSRGRYLRKDELKPFWDALTEPLLGRDGEAAFKILFLTAQREMEVLRMRWQDIDWQDFLWTIPADHAKNEYEHVVPLTPAVLWELGTLRNQWAKETGAGPEEKPPGGYVFPSPILPGEHVRRVFIEKRIIKVREASGIKDVTVHDLRRTVTTYFGTLRVPQEIKKKILNHTKRKKADVTDIYDRFEYVQEKRGALLKWEKLLLRVVGAEFDTDGYAAALFNDDETNVIPIGRGRA